MKNRNIFFGGTLVVLILGLGYFFLPVPYTIYVQRNDGALSAADPVSQQTPLQQCLDGDFRDANAIDLLLATYNRNNTNTNHLEVFTNSGGTKNTLYAGDFSSSSVSDNDYYTLNFPEQVSEKTTNQLCFLLTSKDATPQNSITYWLNSQSQPVLKVKSTVPLHKAVEQVASANRFGLPIWLAIALCLLYLGASASAILFICHEGKNQISKASSPHSHRTRQKRV